MNGNGHPDIPRFFRTNAIEVVARAFGYKTEFRVSVRFPARVVTELEAWIRREGKTGRLTIGFSEGAETNVSWEEVRERC